MQVPFEEKSKSILFAIGSSEYGGAQKIFHTIVSHYRERGYSIHVILPDGILAQMLVKDQITITIINFKSIVGLLKIKKVINENEFDIINTHLTNCSLIISFINLFFRIPIFCSLHNSIIHQKLNIFQKCIYPYIYYCIYKFSDRIIVNSKVNRDEFVNIGKIDINHISVIPNGIDVVKSSFLKLKKNNKFTIGYVGRLSLEKGVIYLLQALSSFKDYDFECLIIGDGPLRSELEAFTKKVHLENNVKFLGFQVSVNEYFQIFDVFVLPSLNEVLPITIIEAFALKKITISSDIGGVPDLISNFETGLLFPPRDVFKLRELLKWVYLNTEEVNLIQENAHNKYNKLFTSSQMLNRIDTLFGINLVI
jgi:glycosyltransferase involved in cell wall biosynthesis